MCMLVYCLAHWMEQQANLRRVNCVSVGCVDARSQGGWANQWALEILLMMRLLAVP